MYKIVLIILCHKKEKLPGWAAFLFKTYVVFTPWSL